MVDRDGADEFVTDIVDELMETTMSAIYDKYIQIQLLPFTITQARDAITEIIEVARLLISSLLLPDSSLGCFVWGFFHSY